MSNINRILSYSASPFWILIAVAFKFDNNLLLNSGFWVILIILCLPLGLIMEFLFSNLYYVLKRILKLLGISIKFSKLFNVESAEDFTYGSFSHNYSYFQKTLSENNFLRNSWMSIIISVIFLGIFWDNSKSDIIFISIYSVLFFLCVLGNCRTEILLKKIKIQGGNKNE